MRTKGINWLGPPAASPAPRATALVHVYVVRARCTHVSPTAAPARSRASACASAYARRRQRLLPRLRPCGARGEQLNVTVVHERTYTHTVPMYLYGSRLIV